jgi:putative membrane protein
MTVRWLLAALHNHFFWMKMTLLRVIIALEVAPMIRLIKWRVRVARGEQPDTGPAGRMGTISFIQAWVVVLMVLAATGMARGFGVPR